MLELNFVLFFFIFFVSSLILVRRMPIASYRSVNGKKRARNLFAHSGCVDVYQGTTLFCIRKIFFFFWSIWSIDITKSSLRKNFNRMKERFSIVSSISCVVVVRAHPSDRAKLQIVMIKVKKTLCIRLWIFQLDFHHSVQRVNVVLMIKYVRWVLNYTHKHTGSKEDSLWQKWERDEKKDENLVFFIVFACFFD